MGKRIVHSFSMRIKLVRILRIRIAGIQQSFKNNATHKLQLTLGIFVYSRYGSVCRLTFALAVQYLLFCSTSVMHDEVRHQPRFEYIPLIFRRDHVFST